MATSEVPAVRHRIEIAPRTIWMVFGLIAGIWVLGQLTTVVSVITVALVLVGTFAPGVSWLEHRGIKRGRALVLVFSVAALALVGIVLLMIPPLVSQVLNLIEGAPKMRENIMQNLEGRAWAKPVIGALQDLPLDDLVTNAGTTVIGYSTTLFIMIGYGLSTMFLAIYLLADPARAQGMLYAVVPRHHHVKLARILQELKVIVGGYVRGQLITSLSIAVFVFVLLTILGVDNALPIALFAGLTDIIPFVGGYVASTPVVLATIPHGTVTAIVVLVLMFMYQEFESRILVPRVYGRTLRLHPAIVVVALLIGGTMAGILGALLALPIAAGVQMLLRELRVDLPGATPASEEVHERDERAAQAYEEMIEGATPAEASVIAGTVATIVKETEGTKSGASLTSELAVVGPKPH